MVEKWLLQVEGMMKESISGVCAKSYKAYPTKPRTSWVLDWPGMIVLAVDQIFWTRETEEALSSAGLRGLKGYEEKCTAQLDEIVQLVRTDLSSCSAPPSARWSRSTSTGATCSR